ncbi:hypothetical protein OZD70_02585 [Wolbachia endosymbiont of Drosophila tsacasi]|nr:hypothetical protein [Wolbachia endosymbiont of Drosophila tsacasi]
MMLHLIGLGNTASSHATWITPHNVIPAPPSPVIPVPRHWDPASFFSRFQRHALE